jgi:hypothetical protein
MTTPDVEREVRGVRPGRTAYGYTVVLPPGWVRLDVGSDDALAEVEAAVQESMPPGSKDSLGPLVEQLRRRATVVLQRARDNGAVDVYLPLRGVRGRPVPASFVVAVLRLPDPPGEAVVNGPQADRSAALMSTLVARTPGAQMRQLPAGPAVRSRQVVEPEMLTDDPRVSRVDYHLPVPGDPTRVVVVTFNTAGTGDPGDDVAELLVDLFDALMTTWRWNEGLVL